MIKSVRIKNFKTLKDIDVPMKPLNLLTGLNGTGKSSFIQSLLLLRQSVIDSRTSKGYLKINDFLTQIGNGKDALYQFAQNELLLFGVKFEHFEHEWEVTSTSDEDFFSPISDDYQRNEQQYKLLKEQSLFSDNFQYLNVEHIGPKLEYETSQWAIRRNDLGVKGEFAPHYLYSFGNRKEVIFENLHHQQAKTKKLIQQVDAWLGEISPNIKIDITDIPNSNKLILSFRYATKGDVTQQFKPTNVGFGISYVLPVIVSILSAEKDKLIILENPEAHLHPKGQSRIGRLMALAAENDIQIIAETHSDHILNRIRVAVKKGEVSPEKVNILYFERTLEEREHQAKIHIPKINKNGRIDKWPQGFFDEWDNMLDELIM